LHFRLSYASTPFVFRTLLKPRMLGEYIKSGVPAQYHHLIFISLLFEGEGSWARYAKDAKTGPKLTRLHIM